MEKSILKNMKSLLENDIQRRSRVLPEKFSGLLYLLGVALLTAIAAGAFRMDKGILLWPASIGAGVLLAIIGIRKGIHKYKNNILPKK